MQPAHDLLLQASRGLNDRIRELDALIASGAPRREAIEPMRREAAESLAKLRGQRGTAGATGGILSKVAEHLDLFIEIAGSTGTEPAVARKLLGHLLAEQLELTAEAERQGATGELRPGPEAASRGGGAARSSAASRWAAPAGDRQSESPGPAGGMLPGGRKPLSVGSLINR